MKKEPLVPMLLRVTKKQSEILKEESYRRRVPMNVIIRTILEEHLEGK